MLNYFALLQAAKLVHYTDTMRLLFFTCKNLGCVLRSSNKNMYFRKKIMQRGY